MVVHPVLVFVLVFLLVLVCVVVAVGSTVMVWDGDESRGSRLTMTPKNICPKIIFSS